ncbi:MAG: protein kinase [Pyrinomonadaceae bacterium]|nr:protein kinase [Pyrinomonadaceae bacterium]
MVDQFIGKRLADKYEIEELIRESELGAIYRGTHTLMEKSVAIKILSPALAIDESIVEQFSIEARTISRLSHPNILNVTDFGKDEEGAVFIVMEDAEGRTLGEAIREEGPFTVERAVRIARQIAAALSSAHAGGISHLSLTSEKVLLTEMANDTELVKVLDLGSFNSTYISDPDGPESLERLSYLSPEQCSEETDPDERSDIYSLGIIFFEMLVGEVPFMADNSTDLMLKHAQVPPPPFAAFRDDIPDEIEPIAIRALAKNPDMRYQTASAFAEDLAEATMIDGEDNAMIAPRVDVAAANAAGRNNIWKTAFIVLAGISILAFALIYWTNVKRTNPTTVQTDEQGLPVQPLNPATGLNEQNLPNMADYPSNTEMLLTDPRLSPSDVGGGIPNPIWDRGGNPQPGGAPLGAPGPYVEYPGGTSTSPFNQDEPLYDKDGNQIVLVPRPAQTPTPEPKPKTSPSPEKSVENPTATPSPAKTVNKTPKPSPKPTIEKPKVEDKPKPQPKEKQPPPSSKNKKVKSGVEQDTGD